MVVQLVTGSVIDKKKKVFEVTDKHYLKLSGPKKEELLLKPDGCLYSTLEVFGAKVSSPLTRKEIYELLTNDIGGELPDPVSWLLQNPTTEHIVPTEYARTWGQQLLEFGSESLCVYGVHRKDPKKWLGVVPEQEVTGGSVDVDDFGEALSTLSTLGYRTIGTLHTHPGSMTSCSSIDTGQLWNKFAGLHLIITHTGVLSYHFSTRGITWSLNDQSAFKNVNLWNKKIPKPVKSTSLLLGEDGTEEYRPFIKRKVWNTPSGTRGHKKGINSYTNYYDKEDKLDIYFGEWDHYDYEYAYKKQKDGQRVEIGYVNKLGGYYDCNKRAYYAGKPIGYYTMTKFQKDRFRITDPKVNKIIQPVTIDKKSSKGSMSFMTVLDWMEERTEPSLEDLQYNLTLDEQLVNLGFAFDGLEQFITETISQELHPSANMKTSIIKMLMLMPKLDQLLYGKAGRTLKSFSKLIPNEWKGKV